MRVFIFIQPSFTHILVLSSVFSPDDPNQLGVWTVPVFSGRLASTSCFLKSHFHLSNCFQSFKSPI